MKSDLITVGINFSVIVSLFVFFPVSIANDLACKSLDWLETKLPGLHTPTEQVHVSTIWNE